MLLLTASVRHYLRSLTWVCLRGLTWYMSQRRHARTPRAVAKKWIPVSDVAKRNPSAWRNSALLAATIPTAEQKLRAMRPGVCKHA